MDYYQGVVAEYLRRDRACFVNPEFYLQNDLCPDEAARKVHWYVDVLAIHLRHKCVYLCEVTYAQRPAALLSRLRTWFVHWPTIKQTLARDSNVPPEWSIRPWIFVPQAKIDLLKRSMPAFNPSARVTALEETAPWTYKWDSVLSEDDIGPKAGA